MPSRHNRAPQIGIKLTVGRPEYVTVTVSPFATGNVPDVPSDAVVVVPRVRVMLDTVPPLTATLPAEPAR